MHTAASTTNAKVRASGVAAALAVPDRIVRAVYADRFLPPTGKTLVEMLSDCSRLLKAQLAHARAGNVHIYDANRVYALRQAQDALLAMLTEDDTVVSPLQQKVAA